MKRFTNLYIFAFSSIMVIVVAAILSFVSEQLKPLQEKNIEIEKKTDILRSVEQATREQLDTAGKKDLLVEKLYDQFITESFVINNKGELKEGIDAFTVNIKEELNKPVEERNLPVYISETGKGQRNYIIPVRGKGLWGPIWGYVALEEDMNTIHGAIFDHQSETPGLGAGINTDWFQEKFKGKKIFSESGEFAAIKVVKGGAPDDARSAVDAISGGTITSKGLEAMLYDCMLPYETFFKSKMNES